ncbi:alpha carbonic anhydrase [Tirmania nivea]|nr:alpha carbonic anhydrase [Tirmania nivea]
MLNLCVFGLYALCMLESKASAAAYHDHIQSPFVKASSGLEVTARDGSGYPYWDYTGGTGPLLWAKLNRKEWPLCQSGDLQSPINIDDKMKPSGFRYEWAAPLRACYNMTNTGRTIELRPTCPTIGKRDVAGIMVENDWFNLDSISFHTPSEHRFLEEYYPIEVHFVMKSPKTGRYAVRGIFFDVSNIYESDFWSGISPYLYSVRNTDAWIKLPAVNTMNIMKEFQRAGINNKVYNYQGSLTTPPCSQNVIWDILSVPQPVSVETYNLLKRIIKFNARYTQNNPGKVNLLAEACQKR